ncbi:MAG: D-alanine--D-alanine ligase family protein [Acidimicrobiales bacterium]|nr:D-alanine--D-alanine ligase family protein [Acidimicrobiales bacterium]
MPVPDRIRLVVLFGGQSAEHDVSCVSAYHVLGAVDPERYALEAVGITREGQWVRADGAIAALSGAAAGPGDGQLEATGTAVEPLSAVSPAAYDDLPVVVLPLLHGPHGEDGTVQGLLELAGVPFVGSGVLGSALCMDKRKTKDVLAANGLPQVDWLAGRDTELEDIEEQVDAAGLGYPVFVKPANMGSSVGVSRVADRSDLAAAVALAVQYDEWLVIEEGVEARELEVGVLGNAQPRASVPGEVVPSRDFYDYDDKYVAGAADLRIPADLPEHVAADIRRLAVEAFSVLSCDGMARVDFFYEAGRRGLLINEINTIPGFTPISMYPKLWEASGLPYGQLVDELVRLALDRHERRSRFSTKR